MSEFDRWLRPRDQGLDQVALASGRVLNEFSQARMTAADNLMAKAMRAAEQGDEPRAQRLVERACRLEYDAREEMHPGPWAAHMLLFNEVTDALEECEDARWCDVALDVAAGATGLGRRHLGDVLANIAAQDDLYEVTPPERNRIRRAVGERPLDSDFGLTEDAGVEEQVAVARALLDTALAYHLAYVHPDDS